MPELQVGDKIPHINDGSDCRIMAIVDGYAMLRRPRAKPFVLAVKDLSVWVSVGERAKNAK